MTYFCGSTVIWRKGKTQRGRLERERDRDRMARTARVLLFLGGGIIPRVELELSYLSLQCWQAVCLDGWGQARSRGSERMLRTLKVSDSKRGSGGKRWHRDLLTPPRGRGSSWPELEVTVTPQVMGIICPYRHSTLAARYANVCQLHHRHIPILDVLLLRSNWMKSWNRI